MPDLTLYQVEAIAREGHAHQRNKSGRPYLEHVQAVVDGVRERGGSAEQIAAAWLHDTIEDGRLPAQPLDLGGVRSVVGHGQLLLIRGRDASSAPQTTSRQPKLARTGGTAVSSAGPDLGAR